MASPPSKNKVEGKLMSSRPTSASVFTNKKKFKTRTKYVCVRLVHNQIQKYTFIPLAFDVSKTMYVSLDIIPLSMVLDFSCPSTAA